jgi:hypothetical protein
VYARARRAAADPLDAMKPQTQKGQPFGLPFSLSGAGNRSRTYDLRITNALLYQLSYAG